MPWDIEKSVGVPIKHPVPEHFGVADDNLGETK